MKKIKNIAFDLGGVVLALDYEGAVRQFERIGFAIGFVLMMVLDVVLG